MSLSREELGPALSHFAVLRAALIQVTQDIEPGLDGLAQTVAATLIRRPKLRQAPYHGILAQNATLRAAVTSDGRDHASPVTKIGTSVAARAPNLSLRLTVGSAMAAATSASIANAGFVSSSAARRATGD